MSKASPRGRWSFKLVDDARAHEQVVDQITFAIRSGAFAIGERLPSLDEMSRDTGVSKPTITEAIRVLASRGVVKSQRGAHGGVTVIDDNIPPTLLVRPNDISATSLRELLEARRPVEMHLARLAGERASARDLESMQESIDRLVAYTGHDRTTALHFDHYFHYAMARAAQSDLLAHYHHQILKGITVALHDFMVHQEDPDDVIRLHKRTLQAIAAREPAQIAVVMDEHLAHLERYIDTPT